MDKKNGTSTALQVTEDGKKERLRKTILKRREALVAVVTKVEMLRVELEMTQQEYQARVGSLFLKSNQQDLDIIYFRNLLQLIDEGLTYAQAVEQLDDTYYAQQIKLAEEKEKLRQEEMIYNARAESEKNPVPPDLKKIWKFLVSKFHPDLVANIDERKRREEIMKQINRAYEERDMDTLKRMENEIHIEQFEETTIERLTIILEEIENDIIAHEETYKELRVSTWYRWKINIEKAKKKGEDIFADIERNLLNEIVRKIDILDDLKNQAELKKQQTV